MTKAKDISDLLEEFKQRLLVITEDEKVDEGVLETATLTVCDLVNWETFKVPDHSYQLRRVEDILSYCVEDETIELKALLVRLGCSLIIDEENEDLTLISNNQSIERI